MIKFLNVLGVSAKNLHTINKQTNISHMVSEMLINVNQIISIVETPTNADGIPMFCSDESNVCIIKMSTDKYILAVCTIDDILERLKEEEVIEV